MTWLTFDSNTESNDLAALLALNNEAGLTLQDFLAIAEQVNDHELLGLCRLRMAQLMHCQCELADADATQLERLNDWHRCDKFTSKQKAALDFTEQFIVGAKNISPAQRKNLADALQVSEASTFVYGLYINEAMIRFLTFFGIETQPDHAHNHRAAAVGEKSDRKFIEWVDAEDSQTNPQLLAAYYAFNRATCSLHGIDELTDEIVRLRSAQYHDCKFCQSVRRIVDKPDGVNDLIDEVQRYQHSAKITPAQKTALQVLDTFLVEPANVSDALKDQITQHYSAAQIVELILKEMFWMSNKPMIALGTDPGAVSPSEHTPFEYDTEGNFVLL